MRSAKLYKRILIVFLLVSFSAFGGGSLERMVFDSANAAYAKGKFEEAIKGYESVLANGKVSAELYFNLGNAYYKMNQVGLAILNYERAKKISPDDEDLAANLKLALQRTEDRIDEAPQLFLKEWKNGITALLTEKGWSMLCIILLCISLLLFAVYISSARTGLRKTAFFTGIFVLLTCTGTFFIAKHKYELSVNSAEAIITAGSVTVTGSPDEKGTKLFILHEGTRISVEDENGVWMEIRIPNGNVGWIKSNSLQKI